MGGGTPYRECQRRFGTIEEEQACGERDGERRASGETEEEYEMLAETEVVNYLIIKIIWLSVIAILQTWLII